MVTNLQVQVKTLLYDWVHTDWNIFWKVYWIYSKLVCFAFKRVGCKSENGNGGGSWYLIYDHSDNSFQQQEAGITRFAFLFLVSSVQKNVNVSTLFV